MIFGYGLGSYTHSRDERTLMTNDMMALKGLVEKTSDSDLLREMIGFAAERLMAVEIGALTGAGYHEKSGERMAQRNGYG